MTGHDVEHKTGVRVLLTDTFADHAPAGSVLGTEPYPGVPRRGRDVEARMLIDNGALRMRPLATPGWGREALSYGPFSRQPGLLASVQVLNGHHASQTFYMPETWRQRARRWLSSLVRGRSPIRPKHHENLAVGFFSSPAPSDPMSSGHALVVHASTVDNGELWAGAAGRPLTVLRGLQNLPLAVVVLLRERGAVYYAATVPGDPDLPTFPLLRPLAIDPEESSAQVYVGVHQRILGEVGYRVDTRVYRTDVAVVPAWSSWCTTAVVADRLTGTGPLDGRLAERGGTWTVPDGDLTLGQGGASGHGQGLVVTQEAIGLVHLLATVGRGGRLTVILRADSMTRLMVELRLDGARLLLQNAGVVRELTVSPRLMLRAGREQSVQVLDSARNISVHVAGHLVLEHRLAGDSWPGGNNFGFATSGQATVRDLEAHPRWVPGPVTDQPAWPVIASAGRTEMDERFDGPEGPLDASVSPGSGLAWERIEGEGSFDVVSGGARVRASPDHPNPGRTLYAVRWSDPGFVDLSLDMTPPGTARGQGHNCRAGFVLWQDPENYLVINVWLDDWLEGTSVSTFYRVDGHEDMHDAVWTLTGHSVSWGVPFTLRAVFDGERFTAYVDDRPVLYRAIRDVYPRADSLQVRKLALIANEEWGDDTGTVFTRLIAAGRRTP